MTDLVIHDDVADDLRRISEQEQRPIEDVLRSMILLYRTASDTTESHDPLEDFIGAFDDDVSDMSSTVRETLDDYYRKKYGDSH